MADRILAYPMLTSEPVELAARLAEAERQFRAAVSVPPGIIAAMAARQPTVQGHRGTDFFDAGYLVGGYLAAAASLRMDGENGRRCRKAFACCVRSCHTGASARRRRMWARRQARWEEVACLAIDREEARGR